MMLVAQGQRRFRFSRFQHLITQPSEELSDHLANSALVLDQQNRFTAPLKAVIIATLSSRKRFLHRGYKDFHARPSADATCKNNIAIALIDDSVHDRQPETSALPRRFRSEKGFKCPRDRL